MRYIVGQRPTARSVNPAPQLRMGVRYGGATARMNDSVLRARAGGVEACSPGYCQPGDCISADDSTSLQRCCLVGPMNQHGGYNSICLTFPKPPSPPIASTQQAGLTQRPSTPSRVAPQLQYGRRYRG